MVGSNGHVSTVYSKGKGAKFRRSTKYLGLPCGLHNQASTCYLNSLVQVLYMTTDFRNVILREGGHCSSHCLLYILREVFLEMKESSDPIDTIRLTQCLGTKVYEQRDVQEFWHELLDILDRDFESINKEPISHLYTGGMKDYVKCLQCKTEDSRVCSFLDIPLVVKPYGQAEAYGDLMQSLSAFEQSQRLDGANMCYCLKCKTKQVSDKGLTLLELPLILTFQLMRYEFDYQTGRKVKINTRLEFPYLLKKDIFSLQDEASDEGESQDGDGNRMVVKYEYELFAILVHMGGTSAGHYYAYAKYEQEEQWYFFDDHIVRPVTEEDTMEAFGGKDAKNAYMLMYSQKKKEEDVELLLKGRRSSKSPTEKILPHRKHSMSDVRVDTNDSFDHAPKIPRVSQPVMVHAPKPQMLEHSEGSVPTGVIAREPPSYQAQPPDDHSHLEDHLNAEGCNSSIRKNSILPTDQQGKQTGDSQANPHHRRHNANLLGRHTKVDVENKPGQTKHHIDQTARTPAEEDLRVDTEDSVDHLPQRPRVSQAVCHHALKPQTHLSQIERSVSYAPARKTAWEPPTYQAQPQMDHRQLEHRVNTDVSNSSIERPCEQTGPHTVYSQAQHHQDRFRTKAPLNGRPTNVNGGDKHGQTKYCQTAKSPGQEGHNNAGDKLYMVQSTVTQRLCRSHDYDRNRTLAEDRYDTENMLLEKGENRGMILPLNYNLPGHGDLASAGIYAVCAARVHGGVPAETRFPRYLQSHHSAIESRSVLPGQTLTADREGTSHDNAWLYHTSEGDRQRQRGRKEGEVKVETEFTQKMQTTPGQSGIPNDSYKKRKGKKGSVKCCTIS